MPSKKSILRSDPPSRLTVAVVFLAVAPAAVAAPAVSHVGLAVTIPPATLVIALAIVAAIILVFWLTARERRYHLHADDAGVLDEPHPAHEDSGEPLQRLGTFQPRDAKRLLALLAEHEVPFELEEEYSPDEVKTLYVPLRTTNLVVHVPESSFAQASAILCQTGFAPEMEEHPGG